MKYFKLKMDEAHKRYMEALKKGDSACVRSRDNNYAQKIRQGSCKFIDALVAKKYFEGRQSGYSDGVTHAERKWFEREREEFVSLYNKVKFLEEAFKRVDDDLMTVSKSTSKVFTSSYYNKKSKTYLIKNKRNGLYKIGRSVDPIKREKTLQSEEPLIELVKVWKKNIEKDLHNEFEDVRVRGEWFNLNKVQVERICKTY